MVSPEFRRPQKHVNFAAGASNYRDKLYYFNIYRVVDSVAGAWFARIGIYAFNYSRLTVEPVLGLARIRGQIVLAANFTLTMPWTRDQPLIKLHTTPALHIQWGGHWFENKRWVLESDKAECGGLTNLSNIFNFNTR